MPNKLLAPEKFAHPVLFLFHLFRNEKELLSGFPPMYQKKKLQEEEVQVVVNKNKMEFVLYCDLISQAFLQFNENLINNQSPHSQIKNDELPGAEHPNEKDSEGEHKQNFCTSQSHATNIRR